MKIAVASGKGGTGKTMISASLVTIWDTPVTAVDLDVEEPNLHLFLKPEISLTKKAFMEVPKVDETACDYCRKCSDFCGYKAISVMNEMILLFSEMCHGCGGCFAVCPNNALLPDKRVLGEILRGKTGENAFVGGKLKVGEAMSPPLIKQVVADLDDTSFYTTDADVIMDAPPGVSCPAVNAVMDADFIVMVTEPTPFGVYDLTLAHEAFAPLKKPMGVVVNKAGVGNDRVYEFCRKKELPVLCDVPYDRAVAETYSQSEIIATMNSEMEALFTGLKETILETYASFMKEAEHA